MPDKRFDKVKSTFPKPPACAGCPLEHRGFGFTHPTGTGSTPLLIVGESAGFFEAKQGYGFQPNAEAGSVLERAFKQLGYQREQFALWNLIACSPPLDKLAQQPYEGEAINHCRSYFDLVVNKYKPKVILALGSLPLKYLTGFSGRKKGVENMRGYFLKGTRYEGIPVISSYHPSFLRRGNMKLFNLFCKDLSKAVAAAQGRLLEGRDFWTDPIEYAKTLNFITNPTIEQAYRFLSVVKYNPTNTIAYDIETEKSAKEDEDDIEDFGTQITQIQFSLRKGRGIAFPYREPFNTVAAEIFSSTNPKAGHNVYKFDNPILRANGFDIKGKITDTMWLTHHIQADLPLHLQAAASYVSYPTAWKHLAGEDLATYGIYDVDSVQWIMEQMPRDLERLRLREGYETYVEKFYPILEQMTARGVPVNVNSLEELSKQVKVRQAEIQVELDKAIPEGLRKVLPTKDGYKVLSKETKRLIEELTVEWQQAQNPIMIQKVPPYIQNECELMDLEEEDYTYEPLEVETERLKQARLSTLEQWIEQNTPDKNGVGLVQRSFEVKEGANCVMCKGSGIELRQAPATEYHFLHNIAPEVGEYTCLFCQGKGKHFEVKRWCRIEPFSPLSPKQVAAFISYKGDTALAKKVMAKLVKAGEIEEESKTPTDKAVLAKLAKRTGEKVYELIVEFRELTKIQGTFIEGWTPRKMIGDCSICGEHDAVKVPANEICTEERYVCGNCMNIDSTNVRGRVHPEFSFRPSTWQLSSYKPNAQQISKHSELGMRFRKCIEAYPGHTLVELDFSGFHARMIGYLAEDWNYYRLTAIDVHSYLTGHILKLEGMDTCLSLSDSDLKDFLNKIKKAHKHMRDFKVKKVVLGINLGLSENGCYERNKEDFDPSLEEVLRTFRKEPSQEAIDKKREMLGKLAVKNIYIMLRKLFPKIFQYQERVAMQAYEQGYLQTPYGGRRWFHEVKKAKFKQNGQFWEFVNGQQREEALAFPVQANSHGHYRAILLRLQSRGLLEKYRLVNLIHDSVILECPDSLVDECVREVSQEMQKESEVLKGFSCGTDVMVGKSMDSLREYK